MIGIEIKNRFLDLGDVKITLKYDNPIFLDNLFVKSFSYNFSIPKTDLNISILDNVNSLNSTNSEAKYGAKVTFNGSLLMETILVVVNNTNSKIIINFQSKDLNLFKTLSGLKLPDVQLDEFFVYDETEVATNKQVKWGDHLDLYVQDLDNGVNRKTHHFPPMRCNDIYNGSNLTFVGNINYYDWNSPAVGGFYPSVYLQNYNPAVDPDFKYTFSPCPLYIYVVEKVLNEQGFFLRKNDFIESEVVQNMIIYSANIMENLVVENVKRLNVYQGTYKLQDFLPNISQNDLLEVFYKMFKCIVAIENNEVSFTPINEVLTGPIEDITKYCSPAFNKENIDTGKTVFTYSVLTDEKYYREQINEFAPVQIGDNTSTKETPVESNIARPLANTSENYGGGSYENLAQLALDKIVGASTFLNKPEKIELLLLGLYRGYYDKYPLFTNLTTANTPVTGTGVNVGQESILWGGDSGTVKNHWEEFVEYDNNSNTIEKTLYLPLHVFKNMSTFKDPIKSFYHENGKVQGILSTLTVTLTNKGISATKAEFKIRK